MAKLIRNKVELEKFNMGIEFEFFVKRSALTKDNKEKNQIPEHILNKYGHLFNIKNQNNFSEKLGYEDAGKYFLNKLDNLYSDEKWKNIFKIEYDGSILSDTKKIGVEMILKHDNANITLNRLRKILTILNEPEFITTRECGLHINISFIEDNANRKDLVIDVAKNLNINNILMQFKRKNNVYCKSNLDTEIDSYGFNIDILSGLVKTFITENSKTTDYEDYSFKTILNMVNNLKNKKNFEKFANILENTAKQRFVNEWSNDDRPAIAPKTYVNKNYLEFRLMGGKDYQKKVVEIENGISEYLKSMKKSHFDYQKQINKVSVQRLKMA